MIIFNLYSIRLYMILSDCYRALGLRSGENYTCEQLRKAYLEKAKETHPDMNPQDPTATQSFQHLNTCYETLLEYHTKSVFNDMDDEKGNDFSVEDYKHLFEQWTMRAQHFWDTSVEAKVIKQMWTHVSNYTTSKTESHSPTTKDSTDSSDSDEGDNNDNICDRNTEEFL